jgi:YesN/AraC family two-component response regulator
MSKKFYRPVKEILKIIGHRLESGQTAEINEYEYIKNYLTGVSDAEQDKTMQIPPEFEEKLLQYMAGGKLKDAEGIMASLLLNLKGKNNLPVNIKMLSVRLLNIFFKLIMDLDLKKKDTKFNNEVFFSNAIKNLLLVNDIDDCQEFFINIINNLGGAIIEKHNEITNNNAQLIKNYIDENFDKILSLDIIADYIALNPNYAGRIFKQYFHIGIADYINQVRIGKAVELLESDNYKINNLARMTGFSNATYFIQMFKKLKGITPGQYKETKRTISRQPSDY